jgi:hypothetical protein
METTELNQQFRTAHRAEYCPECRRKEATFTRNQNQIKLCINPNCTFGIDENNLQEWKKI